MANFVRALAGLRRGDRPADTPRTSVRISTSPDARVAYPSIAAARLRRIASNAISARVGSSLFR